MKTGADLIMNPGHFQMRRPAPPGGNAFGLHPL
jgi:hypothetical protein